MVAGAFFSTAVGLALSMHLIASYPGRSVAFSDVFCLVAPHGCPCPERFTRLLGAGRQMVAGAFFSTAVGVDQSSIHPNASFPGRSVAFFDVFCLVAPHGCPCPERFTRVLVADSGSRSRSLLGSGLLGSGLLGCWLLGWCLLRCCLLGKVL